MVPCWRSVSWIYGETFQLLPCPTVSPLLHRVVSIALTSWETKFCTCPTWRHGCACVRSTTPLPFAHLDVTDRIVQAFPDRKETSSWWVVGAASGDHDPLVIQHGRGIVPIFNRKNLPPLWRPQVLSYYESRGLASVVVSPATRCLGRLHAINLSTVGYGCSVTSSGYFLTPVTVTWLKEGMTWLTAETISLVVCESLLKDELPINLGKLQ